MSLQNLPVEIICMIIRLVGSNELRKQDGCCLLVSKRWRQLAEPILFEDLVLNAHQLIKLPEKTHIKLRDFLHQLTIEAHGTGHWPTGEDIAKLNGTLSSLMLHGRRLSSFNLRAYSQFDPGQPLAPRQNYLAMWSPAGLLYDFYGSQLLNLELDTCGSEIDDRIHVCPRLALKIPSLRSIRLRMRRICPEILNLEHEDGPSSSKIQNIIINLSMKENDRFSAGYSHHCTEPRRAWDLYDDMVMMATEVAKHTPTLKVLRILCHKHPYLEIVAKDCISGTRSIIPDDGEWDWGDDGTLDTDDDTPSSPGFSSTDSDSS